LILTVIDDAVKQKFAGKKLEISIKGIDDDSAGLPDKIKYCIEGEDGGPIHDISMKVLKKDKVLDSIIAHKIVAISTMTSQIGSEPLISRFSESQPLPKTFWERIKRVLSDFFTKVKDQFTFIDKVWEGITHSSEKQIKWDINVLSEVSGEAPTEKITLHSALKYLHKIMEREQGVSKDPELKIRLEGAIAISKAQDSLRKHFSGKALKKSTEQIVKKIDKLEEGKKILLPVGYYDNGELSEMLLEIEKAPAGKYTVSLISTSQDVKEYFDKKFNSPGSGVKSIVRKIENVEKNDVLARLPVFLELATSPACREKVPNHPWRDLFFNNLKFPGSQVVFTQPSEKFGHGAESGLIREGIAYLEEAQGSTEESQRFDLAIRLRMFIDICHANKKGWSDPKFWGLLRTTAHELAGEIEENRALIGDEKAQEGELIRIFAELKDIMDKLEANPPKALDPSKQKLNYASGKIEVTATPPTPMVTLAKMSRMAKEEVDPPFALIDETNPTKSFTLWTDRFNALKERQLTDTASNEAKLIIRSLPPLEDPMWEGLTPKDAGEFINALNSAATVLKKGVQENKNTSLEDMVVMTIIGYYGCHTALSRGKQQDNSILKNMFDNLANDLLKCRLSPSDQSLIRKLQKSVDVLSKQSVQTSANINLSVLRDGLSGLIAVNKQANGDTPLYLQHPPYAANAALEITNRYITQQCPLGCTGDNCPNYGMTPKENMRFHPLYMAHNFVEAFSKKIIGSGIARDEALDLLYTQTTLQAADDLFKGKHAGRHGTAFAHGFDANDRKFQVMLTWMSYMQHPNFFKSPELRWHFETKMFTEKALVSILDQEHAPFVRNMIKQLTREIKIAYAAGDIEKCAYLVYVHNCIRDILAEEKKNVKPGVDIKSLEDLLSKDADKILQKFFKEFIDLDESKTIEKQRMVYTLYMNTYFEKFRRNPKDPALEDRVNLANILIMGQRLEKMQKEFEKADPEFIEHYQMLMTLILPRIQKLCRIDASFANNVLTNNNPLIAAKGLDWKISNFPLLTATDKDGKEYLFNLSNGDVSIGARLVDSLPHQILEDVNLKRIFGAALNEEWTTLRVPEGLSSNDTVVYVHRSFPQFRLLVKGKRKLETTIERTVKNSLGKDEWVSYVRFNEQEKVYNGEEITSAGDLPTQVAAAIGERDCWVDTNKSRIYVMEGKRDQPYAILTLNTHKNPIDKKVETVVADMQFTEGNSHLLDPEERSMERFATIELPKFLQVRGKNHSPDYVEYHRYELVGNGATLKYSIGKDGITSPTFPGYRLEENGVRPGSKDSAFGVRPLPTTFDGYQLLKKGGAEKVLIPMRHYEQQFGVKGEALPYSKTTFPDNFKKTSLFEYRVDVETNRLLADSPDAYAYLAYVCLTHGDYGSSRFYLDKARTSSGYSENNDQIFEWLSDWKDSSPNGNALKLHFALLHEKIVEDRRNAFMVKGDTTSLAALEASKDSQLIEAADFYKNYVTKSALDEMDPTLVLSPSEEIQIKKMVQELIHAHGHDDIETGEVKLAPAIQIPEQEYVENDEKDPLVYQKSALLLWSNRIGEKGMSPLSVRDPLWVVQNFREIFNKILKGDLRSSEVKQLILQVEMVSQLPIGSLNPIEQNLVHTAQIYLMKLVTAKKDYPVIYGQFDPFLKDGVLPPMSLSYFETSRSKKIELANDAAKEGLYSFKSMQNKEAALASVKQYEDAVYLATLKRGGRKDITYLKKTAPIKNIHDFIENYNGDNFYGDYRYFLLEQFYGVEGAKCIDTYDEILKVLEPIPINTDKQTHAKIPYTPAKRNETYQERYGSLLTSDLSQTSDEEIKTLEEKVFSGEEPPAPPIVVTPPDKKAPVLGDLGATCLPYLKVTTIPPQSISKEVFDSLKRSDEPSISRNAGEHEADMDKALLRDTQAVTIKREGVVKIVEELEKELSNSKEPQLRSDLMQYIESFDKGASIIAIRRLAGKEAKLNLDSLISLWLRGEITKPWSEHVFKTMGIKQMSPEVLQILDNKVKEYLMAVTSGRHLKQTLDIAADYEKSCGHEASDVGDKFLALDLYNSLTAKRFYSVEDPDVRDLMFMEYNQGIILREGQVNTFRDMISTPAAVRQLEMGGGKSKVLLPLLAKKKANGHNLVALVLPEELYETNCRDLDVTNRMLFGQVMHRFEFGRATAKDSASLKLIHLRLLKTIESQGFIMTTKRSMLSFKNAYAEKLCQLESTIPEKKGELIAEIREMSKILAIFNDHTDVIADEVDACLDVRKEDNFSLGEATPVNSTKKDTGIQMMKTLLAAREGTKLGDLKKRLSENTQASLSQDDIDNCMEEIAKDFLSNLGWKVDEKAFLDYIMDRPGCQEMERAVLNQKVENPERYQKISALKGFIHRGFGSTLKRIGQVNYGRDPISGIWTIPYKASNTPAIGSVFDDDVERISLTIQDYLQFGVSYKLVFKTIAEIHNRAVAQLREVQDDPDTMIGINDTEAAQDFKELMKKLDPEGKYSNINLSSMGTPSRIEALTGLINSSAEGRLIFAEVVVMSQMDQTNVQINSVSSDLPEMARHFSGFTGTPWNLHTYHDKIKAEKNLGVDGRTWALMLSRDIPITTFSFDAKRPVESLLSELDIVGKNQALIDTGSYLRGVDNSEFIEKAMKKAAEKGAPTPRRSLF